ncbi:hypothetical protein CCR75_002564 [Bremia lactucae]|uniref:Uncharacterized protein n=1 Tax=Bremia lactucae TaxID=4779 RepID=A0A976FMA6_BRELC|nr:hypothetical protein CCR75_002564 [Bremia lactucae]
MGTAQENLVGDADIIVRHGAHGGTVDLTTAHIGGYSIAGENYAASHVATEAAGIDRSLESGPHDVEQAMGTNRQRKGMVGRGNSSATNIPEVPQMWELEALYGSLVQDFKGAKRTPFRGAYQVTVAHLRECYNLISAKRERLAPQIPEVTASRT